MAARTWTVEQRRQQAKAIKRWKPWESSTGPRSLEGKAKASVNAFTGGEQAKLRQFIRTINQVLKEQKKEI